MSPLGDKAHHPLFASPPQSFFASTDFNQHCSFVSPLFICPSHPPDICRLCPPPRLYLLQPPCSFIHPLISQNIPPSLGFSPSPLENIKFNSIYISHSGICIFFFFWRIQLINGGILFNSSFFSLMFSLYSCPPSSSLSLLWRSITPHHLDPPFFSLHLSLSTCSFQSQRVEANLRTSALHRKR